jgi:hypothetical protein
MLHARSASNKVPATKYGQDASFSIFGGWHLFLAPFPGGYRAGQINSPAQPGGPPMPKHD